MIDKETQYIDILFLELSQFTKATTGKELKLQAEIAKVKEFARELYNELKLCCGEYEHAGSWDVQNLIKRAEKELK